MDLWNLKFEDFGHWTVDCVPFYSIDSFHIVQNWANSLKKSYFRISEKHDQTSINLANAFLTF